jgi:hypothetical protein
MELILPAVALLIVAAVAIVYRRFTAPATLPVTAAWIDELSVDRYQPMRRLLARDDLGYLRSRPGFTARTAADFRRERCRIFQSYLECLHSDFQRVCMALKIVMVQSRYDRPDLAALLIHSQRAFVFGLMMVHGRMLLYRWGLGSVEVSGLLKLFDTARIELRSLVPAQMGMAA